MDGSKIFPALLKVSTFLAFAQKFKDDCRKENYNEEPFRLIETEPQIIADVLTKSKLEPFTVNDRLFTEHMVKENATVYGKDRHRKWEVSIPKSVLQPTYEVKPHRRGSFDSCDSLHSKTIA
ncbi:hypothetical protein Btru_035016 [Bulinus truncatus]|nr:hypothetical protein Btru_035016 [Bulinus truncatus]